MTVTAKALQPGLALGTGDTTLYTAPASTTAYVQSATIVNTDSVARTFNIRRVGVGAAPDVYLIKGVSLAAGKTTSRRNWSTSCWGPGTIWLEPHHPVLWSRS
jgi:hypothetical protein